MMRCARDPLSPFSRRACSPRIRRSPRPAIARRAGSPAKRRAFTLIEVTISVALAVVLMLGISEVFRVVGETVGTGEALATAQRDARAAQTVMASDFNSAVTDGSPYMLLYSQQQWAFRNQADLLGDKDGNPATFDTTGAGTESLQPPAIYNYRSHRIDALTFFGRGTFARQTGGNTSSNGYAPFVANMGSVEAMLWYGHLNLADNNGTFTTSGSVSNNTPGAGTATLGSSTYYATVNPNNYFATSWILGRQQETLRVPSTYDNNNSSIASQIVDSTYPNGDPQYAYMPNPASVPLSPLAAKSVAYKSTGTTSALPLYTQAGTPNATLISSRLDLAATSIANYRTTLTNYINNSSSSTPPWYTLLPTGDAIGNLRFQAQPFFLTKPPTPETMAYQAPIFVRGCTQFTVEYAGDYLNQVTLPLSSSSTIVVTTANQGITDTYEHYNATNGYTTGTTDGQVDYILTAAPSGGFVQKIRWYGFPRSTTNTPNSGGTGIGISLANGDVVPLRDTFKSIAANPGLLVSAATNNLPTAAPFEQAIPTYVTDYGTTSGVSSASPYLCAWGPNDRKPKMIRITMTIDDPGGRLGDGQTYEYIYTLP